jgi:hypothetical protein
MWGPFIGDAIARTAGGFEDDGEVRGAPFGLV